MAMNRAVFIDKDGTLVENVPYNVDPAAVRLMPGAVEGLAALQGAGYRLIVVSNQSGLARGYFGLEALDAAWERIRGLVGPYGIRLDGWYFCPHLPDGKVARFATTCDCRKPAPGLLHRAAAEQGLDLSRCWMAGDILDDVEAGCRAGCRTVLIDNGHETEWLIGPGRSPDCRVRNLEEAAEHILAADGVAREREQGVAR